MDFSFHLLTFSDQGVRSDDMARKKVRKVLKMNVQRCICSFASLQVLNRCISHHVASQKW